MPPETPVSLRVRASDELRQAALEQFATVGFAATSLQQVADHAGYAKSNVLYHYGSKEALLEAAIGPAINEFEAVLEQYLAGPASDRRTALVGSVVDLLIDHRLAVHIFILQGPSLSEVPIIGRANAAVRRLAEAVGRERESLDEHIRFGIALGGAAYLLTAGRLFTDDEPPSDDELRGVLHQVLGELLLPAAGRTSTTTTTD
ncbi:TetR/AcrR family transcriptional regulator [Agromyces neolithicus]|uniref:HTH tetR-type domain-containing protein n=1 Tax=Agromyces neolithicus TaxID=269420 RepID=A0ABN2MDX0_9MICO